MRWGPGASQLRRHACTAAPEPSVPCSSWPLQTWRSLSEHDALTLEGSVDDREEAPPCPRQTTAVPLSGLFFTPTPRAFRIHLKAEI